MKGVLALLVLAALVVLVVFLIRSDFFSDIGGQIGGSGEFFKPYTPNTPSIGLAKDSTSSSDSSGAINGDDKKNKSDSPKDKPKIPEYKIPRGFTEDDLSVYFDKVRISSVSRANNNPDSYSRIVLTSSITKDESVNISGWTIVGNEGRMVIPQGVEIYSPYTLNVPQDIFMKRGQQVKIYSTKSPLGVNFLINLCTGYLDNVFTFTPRLPKSCPKIDYKDISYLDGDCQDYIRSLGVCESADNTNLALARDAECRAVTDRLNYKGCFDDNHTRDDFFKKEWRVWMGDRFMRLDKSHDRLLIYDRDGFIVDEYTY